jgi:hypothetical protein
MSARVRSLATCQYTDIMRMVDADHVVAATSGDAIMLLAIPVLWILGVIVFIAFKFHTR